jgi:hypothetical protein
VKEESSSDALVTIWDLEVQNPYDEHELIELSAQYGDVPEHLHPKLHAKFKKLMRSRVSTAKTELLDLLRLYNLYISKIISEPEQSGMITCPQRLTSLLNVGGPDTEGFLENGAHEVVEFQDSPRIYDLDSESTASSTSNQANGSRSSAEQSVEQKAHMSEILLKAKQERLY